jgi:hypothetical protein
VIFLALPHPGLAQGSIEPVPDVQVISIEPVIDVSDGLTTTEFTVIGAVAFFLFSAVRAILQGRAQTSLIQHYRDLVHRDDLRNEVERRYLASSLRVQDIGQLFRTFVNVIANANLPLVDEYFDETADFLEDVTDGEIEPPSDQPQ